MFSIKNQINFTKAFVAHLEKLMGKKYKEVTLENKAIFTTLNQALTLRPNLLSVRAYFEFNFNKFRTLYHCTSCQLA